MQWHRLQGTCRCAACGCPGREVGPIWPWLRFCVLASPALLLGRLCCWLLRGTTGQKTPCGQFASSHCADQTSVVRIPRSPLHCPLTTHLSYSSLAAGKHTALRILPAANACEQRPSRGTSTMKLGRVNPRQKKDQPAQVGPRDLGHRNRREGAGAKKGLFGLKSWASAGSFCACARDAGERVEKSGGGTLPSVSYAGWQVIEAAVITDVVAHFGPFRGRMSVISDMLRGRGNHYY